MLIDKCLIIDDKLEEVRDVIFELNKHGISTDYKEDILEKDSIINSYTQLVILDLYMSADQSKYEDAINSVYALSNKIEGPYFILIWSKHDKQYDNFCNEINSRLKDDVNLKNLPLEIEIMEIHKKTGQQMETSIKDVVKYITGYIESIKERNKNIASYLKLSNLFREKSFLLWDLFDDQESRSSFETIEDVNKYYEDVVAKAFHSFDNAQNFEKSGKGFLNIQSRFLENHLTLNPLDYSEIEESNQLDEKIKTKINNRLCIHDIQKEDKSVPPMPGVIMENSDLNTSDFNDYFANDNLNDSVKKAGELIITPYCDYATKKRESILYLPILIIYSPETCKKVKGSLKQNINLLDLYNGMFIAYKVKELSVKELSVEHVTSLFDFYLNKEFVNEIQINVANDLTRIGTTTI